MSRLVVLIAFGLLPAVAAGQGYRLRLDTRGQTVAYRGVQLDSIPVSDTVGTPGGGPVSPDGYAVRCLAGAAYCTFFRPGPTRHGGPVTSTADLTLWGFGVTGLSVHAVGRLGVDAGTADVWPGTDPALQLLEGYVEYAVTRATARLGRQLVVSRLGMTGFDGAGVVVRDTTRNLELQGYGGWGLARGVALPLTSAALDPLDEFRPQSRQLIVGAAAGWISAVADARLDYQREVDPDTRSFVSERVGLQGALRPVGGLRVTGGADYDIAAGWWGSADATVAYATRQARGAVTVRRYRPHFDLWTIWGAFSPVPYRSWQASLAVAPAARLEVRGRYERYRFDEAETATPLFTAKRDGWRAELGATATPATGWTVDAGYQREFGPGASVSGTAASVTYQPSRRLRATLLGSALDRPLEFRFNDAEVHVYGFDAEYAPSERVRVGVTAQRYAEEHHRPDAGAFDWNQFRLAARVVLAFGAGADVQALSPSIRLLPGGRSAR